MASCVFECYGETVTYTGSPLEMAVGFAKAHAHFADRSDNGEWVLDEDKPVAWHIWSKKHVDSN